MLVAILSFVFFMAMLIAFYIRQHFGYFLLSTAFLIVFIFTMIGWWMQNRNTLYIHDWGIVYRRFSASWTDLKSVEPAENGLLLKTSGGETVTIARSTAGFETIKPYIISRLPGFFLFAVLSCILLV